MLMNDGGAHGLMDLIECLEKLISEAPITYVSRLGLVDLGSALEVVVVSTHFTQCQLNYRKLF